MPLLRSFIIQKLANPGLTPWATNMPSLSGLIIIFDYFKELLAFRFSTPYIARALMGTHGEIMKYEL
jgi:hypothetical protein